MSIDPQLEGLWQFDSRLEEGEVSYGEPWHYLFREGIYKEIVPDFVDDGTMQCSYEVDVSTRPRRLKITRDYKQRDGRTWQIVEYCVYEVSGDKLRITEGEDGEYPSGFKDSFPFSIKTYIRDNGPIPESKQPSGTPPIVHEELGELAWNDNLHWYEGVVEFNGKSVSICLNPNEAAASQRVLDRALHVVRNDVAYARKIEAYAASELLPVKNDCWLERGQAEISRHEFVRQMSLESFTIYEDGRVAFWHSDGGMFQGHSIQIEIDKRNKLVLADIPG